MSAERINVPIKLATDKSSSLIRGGMRQSRPLESKLTPRTSMRKSRTSRTSRTSGTSFDSTKAENKVIQQNTNILTLHTTTSFRLPARTSYFFLILFIVVIMLILQKDLLKVYILHQKKMI